MQIAIRDGFQRFSLSTWEVWWHQIWRYKPWDACQIRHNKDWDPMKHAEVLIRQYIGCLPSQSFVKERPIPWMMTKTWPSKRSRIYGFSRKETQTTCSPNCRLKCVAELVEMGENTTNIKRCLILVILILLFSFLFWHSCNSTVSDRTRSFPWQGRYRVEVSHVPAGNWVSRPRSICYGQKIWTNPGNEAENTRWFHWLAANI